MPRRFFEGPEKKVELVVVDGHPSLRRQGRDCWERVVRAAKAEILSECSTEVFDAYLLSESSLFVYDEHITMITCGRTQLVDAVLAVLEFVPPQDVAFLALERKNEHFPREQPSSFEEDACRLAERLPGEALRFGEEHNHCIQLFHTTRAYVPDAKDTTLEVLMHGIRRNADCFQGEGEGARARARATGVGAILPGFGIDDHVFEPRGYSLNGLSDEIYYTLHVTPEEIGSYVSFETNYDFRSDPASLVSRVVEIFDPESFDLFAFVPGEAGVSVTLPGYELSKQMFAPICGYGVTFSSFFQPASGPPTAPHRLILR